MTTPNQVIKVITQKTRSQRLISFFFHTLLCLLLLSVLLCGSLVFSLHWAVLGITLALLIISIVFSARTAKNLLAKPLASDMGCKLDRALGTKGQFATIGAKLDGFPIPESITQYISSQVRNFAENVRVKEIIPFRPDPFTKMSFIASPLIVVFLLWGLWKWAPEPYIPTHAEVELSKSVKEVLREEPLTKELKDKLNELAIFIEENGLTSEITEEQLQEALSALEKMNKKIDEEENPKINKTPPQSKIEDKAPPPRKSQDKDKTDNNKTDNKSEDSSTKKKESTKGQKSDKGDNQSSPDPNSKENKQGDSLKNQGQSKGKKSDKKNASSKEKNNSGKKTNDKKSPKSENKNQDKQQNVESKSGKGMGGKEQGEGGKAAKSRDGENKGGKEGNARSKDQKDSPKNRNNSQTPKTSKGGKSQPKNEKSNGKKLGKGDPRGKVEKVLERVQKEASKKNKKGPSSKKQKNKGKSKGKNKEEGKGGEKGENKGTKGQKSQTETGNKGEKSDKKNTSSKEKNNSGKKTKDKKSSKLGKDKGRSDKSDKSGKDSEGKSKGGDSNSAPQSIPKPSAAHKLGNRGKKDQGNKGTIKEQLKIDSKEKAEIGKLGEEENQLSINPHEAKVKTKILSQEFAKPEKQKSNLKQPIPLEYKDNL